MALTDYTSYDDIRAALGVDSEELPDAVLGTPLFSYSLRDAFNTLASDMLSVVDACIAASPRTSAEQDVVEKAWVFATYAVAVQCLDSLPIFSPKMMQEGKTAFMRYSDSPYKFTAEQVRVSYLRSRNALLTAYQAYKGNEAPSATPLPLCGISVPTSDPVTGT